MDTSENRQSGTVDLSGFAFENHVESSIRMAIALAEGRPVNASDLLTAALIVGRKATGSRAFSELASLAPMSELPTIRDENVSAGRLSTLSLNEHLSEAFSVAEPFLKETRWKIWGRDYITLALLVDNDPSLPEFAEKAGTTKEKLQDRWYGFVTSKSPHRNASAWEKWWRVAGVPLPEERASTSKVKPGPAPGPATKGGVAREPETYLFTWDPSRYPFEKLAETARQVRETGESRRRWSSGQRTSDILIGDRVFLMRQGEGPRGLVGSGRIASHVFKAPHWEREKADQKKESNYADVVWDTLQEFPLVAIDKLIDLTGEKSLWASQGSGIHIDPAIAKILESEWEKAKLSLSEDDTPRPDSGGPFIPLPWVDSDAVPVIGASPEYRPSKLDSLDAAEQAKIFATLLVARRVRPPLALGLFGDWGVGKTFFMRLLQETVASVAGKEAASENDAGAVSRAAQIEFNAWHYVDSNLWASLASHIFDGLSEELRGPQDTVEEIRLALRKRIVSSEREKSEASAAIDAARQERVAAAVELENKRAARSRIAARHESHLLERVWQAVLKVEPDPNDPGKKDWPDISEWKKKAEEVSKRLGISDAIDGVEELRRVYKTMRGISRRGGGLANAFAAAFTGGNAILSLAVVALFIALVLAWPWILSQWEIHVMAMEGAVADGLAPFLQLFTVAGAAAAWATKNLNAISSAMGYLEKIQEEIRQPRIELPEMSEEEKRLKNEMEQIDAGIAAEENRIEEADRQISEAQAEIQRINAGGLVYDFLEERVRDSRYLDRLGLISVIRRDFEQLSGLASRLEKKPAGCGRKAHRTHHSLYRRSGPLRTQAGRGSAAGGPPPARLRPVRGRSGRRSKMAGTFAQRGLQPGKNARNPDSEKQPQHRFSAHNYLEKIFQIPFSLPEMAEDGYRKLVSDIVAMPRTQAEREDARRAREEKKAGETERTVENGRPEERSTDEEESLPESGAAEIEKEGPEDAERPRTEEEQRERERKRESEKQRQEEKRRERERRETAKRIETMLLDKSEEQFISALYVFINTPRLAKRFVNIYRLIRVRAATKMEDFSTFTDRDKGEYRAVLTLLAISVGRAHIAPDILVNLLNAKNGGFLEWLEDASTRQEKSHTRRIEKQTTPDAEPSAEVSPDSRKSPPEEMRKAMIEVRERLAKVEKALDEIDGPPFDDRLEVYRQWVREVGRFSFRWHLRGTWKRISE